MRNILYLIPAREGSRRCINKNFRMFHQEQSLVDLAVKFALQFQKANDKIVLSTDREKDRVRQSLVFQTLDQLGAADRVQILKRPDDLASDTATTASVIQHALAYCQACPDEVVVLQPTSPFRRLSTMASILQDNRLKPNVPIVTGSHRPDGNIYRWLVHRQSTYGIDSARNVVYVECQSQLERFDIDTEEDFNIARTIAKALDLMAPAHQVFPLRVWHPSSNYWMWPK